MADAQHDGEEWPRLAELLCDTLEQPVNLRGSWLDRACGSDTPLRHRVDALLASGAEAEGFMEQPVFSLQPTSLQSVAASLEPSHTPGEHVGPWTLGAVVGRGGMGTVYRAERADGMYEQSVAVKILDRATAGEEGRRRFDAERRILARLQHPGIARLLDGGTMPSGSPYLVMELVEGTRIDRAARDLSLTARLALFRRVCAAIHFAHQNLIVHRDLKPSNILVTADGTPRLLDFGIAKLLDDEQEPTLTRHSTGSPMTPSWASPEQLTGQAITTAADVYGLGLMLFLLLTGEHPSAAERTGCDPSGFKPSGVLRARSELPEAVRALRGDLDTIVEKALRLDPAERYASVEQLDDDVRRYLEGLPIRARPAGTLYLAGKFVRRHAVAVSLVAFLFLALVGFGATMAVQKREIARQRGAIAVQNDDLRQQHDRLETVTEFLLELVKLPDPGRARGKDWTVREAIDRAHEQLIDDSDDEPHLRATLLDAIGRVYMNLAVYDTARTCLEEALSLREVPAASDSERAESLHNLASLDRLQGKLDDAESRMRQAIKLQRPSSATDSRDLARGMANLGSLLLQQGRFAEADGSVREALAMQERLFGPFSIEVARSLNTLATVLRQLHQPEEAEAAYRRSAAIRREQVPADDPGLASTLANLAVLLTHRGAFDEAIALHREALAQRRKVYPRDHPLVASSANGLALALLRSGQAEWALSLLDEAVAMLDRLRLPAWRAGIVRKNRALAWAHLERFEPCRQEALAVLPVLEVAGRELSAHEARAIAGFCLTHLGKPAEAYPLLHAAATALQRDLGADDWRTRFAQRALGDARRINNQAILQNDVPFRRGASRFQKATSFSRAARSPIAPRFVAKRE